MIYVGKVFCLPCGACDAAGKASRTCCQRVSDLLAPITHNPLGGYVLGTWTAMGLVAAGSGYSAAEVTCEDPKVVCFVNLGLTAAHCVFALYLQRRLVSELGDRQPNQLSHSQIAEKAQQVMLRDIGFCLYFFVFFGSFFYNCLALGMLAFSDCSGTGPAWGAAAVMVLYGLGTFNYVVCWYVCQCCCGSFEARLPQSEPGGVIVGAPADAQA